jgi:hypothetical protein
LKIVDSAFLHASDWLLPLEVSFVDPQASAEDQSAFPLGVTQLGLGAVEDQEFQSSEVVLLLLDAGILRGASQLDWSSFGIALFTVPDILPLEVQASAQAFQSPVEIGAQERGANSFRFESVVRESDVPLQSSVLNVLAFTPATGAAATI